MTHKAIANKKKLQTMLLFNKKSVIKKEGIKERKKEQSAEEIVP